MWKIKSFLVGLLLLAIGFAVGLGLGLSAYSIQVGGRSPKSVEYSAQIAQTPAGSTQAQSAPANSFKHQKTSTLESPQPKVVQAQAGLSIRSFVRDIYKKVGPAVVYITTRKLGFDFWLFSETWVEGTGSGFIVDERGYIVTNAHVVADADSISVILAEGEEYPAKLVGIDVGTDTAVIKINPPPGKRLPTVTLGSSAELEVGDWVVAIGNPYGLDRTVTFGVVSALGRAIKAPNGQTIRNVIQTDAAINRGNSGGPLINAKGEVVGVNSAIVTQSGGSEGIGLAIPIDTVKEVLDDLIKYGRVIRPWLGIEVMELDSRRARIVGLSTTEGLIVTAVYKDSPAAKAGILPPLREGGVVKFFIITIADGKKITRADELLDVVRNKKPGDNLELTVVYIEGGTEERSKMIVRLQPLPEEAPQAGVI